jgi:hypothetical protein
MENIYQNAYSKNRHTIPRTIMQSYLYTKRLTN